MIIVNASEGRPDFAGTGTAVTWGNFDGVHLGHQALILKLVDKAKLLGLVSVVVTFDPKPVEFFSKETAPKPLVDDQDKFALLSALGVDYCVVVPFVQDFAAQGAEEFVRNFLVDFIKAKVLVLGHDTCFGRDRRGSFDFLQEARQRYGFEVERVSSVLAGGEAVASTRIRKFIAAGSLNEVPALLGRRHGVHGSVRHGANRGGSILGCPTANLDPGPLLLPPNGVYACTAKISGSFWAAAVNLGVNPSFGGITPSLEAHLLDFEGDLYGMEIRLYFESFLRREQKFASLEELKTRISEDMLKTRLLIDCIRAEPEFAALHPL